jgi:two-component system sensor histidine kinase UhpB
VRSIPLRLRVIGLVAIGLAISLALGGAVACINASHGVRTEMTAALLVAQRAVENALVPSDGVTSLHEVESVITAFEGNRHVRLRLSGARSVSAAPTLEEPAIGRVPRWFVHLLRPAPVSVRVPLPLNDANGEPAVVVIESDPHNEILEAWNALGDALLVLALFCFATFALIYVFIGRALRPLERLGIALQAIGEGDYGPAAEIGGNAAPEFKRLSESFDSMARRLAAADARNRALSRQLMTLQEEERRDIARDLHDEIGPLLFAARVDAASVSRLAETGRVHEIPAVVQGITDAVGQIQGHVRSMLGRLRPLGLAEFGLAEALGHLVAFWRHRHPEIDYRLDVEAIGEEGFGELFDTAIYRLVQEGLSNAVRHGKPGRIDVTVRETTGATPRIILEIGDDGDGAADGTSNGGFGLLGMAERVRALGGTFNSIAGPDRRGFTVRADLPMPNPISPSAAQLTDAVPA